MEQACNNLRNDLEQKVDSHRESKNNVKILEDKLANVEVKFLEECNKLKEEKESFEMKSNS